MIFEKAERVRLLPPYLFQEIDRLKAEAAAKGVDIINMGVGDPDQPTPKHIIESLHKASEDAANHQYPSYSGTNDFRACVAKWYKRRFNVELNASKEVLTLIGSKEGIAHFPMAFINPGDIALIPNPAYPVYHVATMFAGGKSHFMPLVKENNYLPDLDVIPKDIARKAKMMFINYPNNPTGAVAGKDFFEKVVAFAKEYNVMICHDAAYTEMGLNGYRPMSFLEVDGAKEVGIEFHSLSKTYNMTGWRLGFAVGNPEMLSGLGQIKSNIDSGVFNAVQQAGITAIEGDQSCVDQMHKLYEERMKVLVEGLRKAGLNPDEPKASFYVWCPAPNGMTSKEFTSLLLTKAGIVTTPGSGFGDPGEGYVRFALTVSKERIQEAVVRIGKIFE